VADEAAEESPRSITQRGPAQAGGPRGPATAPKRHRLRARMIGGQGRDGPGGTGATASPRGSKSLVDAELNAVRTERGLRRAPGPSFHMTKGPWCNWKHTRPASVWSRSESARVHAVVPVPLSSAILGPPPL